MTTRCIVVSRLATRFCGFRIHETRSVINATSHGRKANDVTSLIFVVGDKEGMDEFTAALNDTSLVLFNHGKVNVRREGG